MVRPQEISQRRKKDPEGNHRRGSLQAKARYGF